VGLQEYHRKRDFAVTPEPRGREAKGGEGRSFVIQKHAATRLHYDFRLELEGVLKSWAVPKGPSFDPADKRLAMRTEDHPVEYGDFEGVIPEGEYGGGTVLLWDRGTWTPLTDPHKGYHSGAMKFELQGEKLRGGWALVKIKGRDARDEDKSWLLVKERDQEARPSAEYDVVKERPESVASGRSLEEIAEAKDRVWHSNRDSEPGEGEAAASTHRAARTARRPASKSGPTIKARKRTAARVDPASLPKARKGPLPRTLTPALATLVTEPPSGDEWLHEMKFDGYRILTRVDSGKAQLLSRNGKDWTAHFPAVARAAADLEVRQALLDGEVAVLKKDGTTSFQDLQNAMGAGKQGEIVYFAFDLLHLDGYDLTGAPLQERKALLAELLAGADGSGVLRLSDHVVGSGRQFFERACRTALEGIVSKRRDAPYEPGRGRSWLKVKCLHRQEFVIGGFTEPSGSRSGIGALLLGVHEGSDLRYVGKVGTGFTARLLQELRRRLDRLEQRTSPFAGAPPRPGGTVHWVKPEMVGEVAFTEWTSDGRLRHPSFCGIRSDKPASEVTREAARPTGEMSEASRRPPREAAKRPPREPPAGSTRRSPPKRESKAAGAEVRIASVKLTHPDRVLYPVQGTTKRDLALFYESIADWILPHLHGRPLTLVRCPEGADQDCFYMKHSGVWAPSSLRKVKIHEKTKTGEYLYVDSLAGLIGLVQMGILEIHTWNSVVDHLEEPDRIVFDLDPGPSVEWTRVVEAARELRVRLRDLELESFVKTTGGVGLHVVVPVTDSLTWDECFEFSRAVAQAMVAADRRAYTVDMPKAGRTAKILIDYLRNNRGNTSVAAYSTRAKPRAPVSTPLTWDELGPDLRSDQFDIASLPRRLASLRADPWADYAKTRQKIKTSARKSVGLG
jgi:bifunctional non-homologous end joining protein LigD